MKVKEENEEARLKFNNQKTMMLASSPITSCQINGGKMEMVTDFIFLGSKITGWWVVTAVMKLKDARSLGEKL